MLAFRFRSGTSRICRTSVALIFATRRYDCGGTDFGPLLAGKIRRKRIDHMRGCCHWRWHLDEMYVKMNGEMVYLWRAVDHEGEILESYVTGTRDKAAGCCQTNGYLSLLDATWAKTSIFRRRATATRPGRPSGGSCNFGDRRGGVRG